MASTAERIYVARSAASATASSPVALSAAASKTVLCVLGSANDTIALKRVRVSFNSVVVTDVPATVEVGIITALGTYTGTTPVQIVGSTLASSATAGFNATAEPTYNRVFDTMFVPVNNGLYDWFYPLGEEPSCDPGQGFGLRITSPQANSCYAALTYSE